MSYKMLYILNVAKRVNNFSFASIKAAKELGIEYSIAGNWSYETDEDRAEDEKKYGIKIYQIDFYRFPAHPGNIKALNQLNKIIKKEKFDLIHCNTPIGGLAGRVLGKKEGTRVIYQAHGFHFYDGAPMVNWLLYYPFERIMAHRTDALITINHEDYERGNHFHLRGNGKVFFVPGVGINLDEYKMYSEKTNCVRKELNIPENHFAISVIGELNKNKNVAVLIKALARLKDKRVHMIICGSGKEEVELKRIVSDKKVIDQVHFVGFRTDIKQILLESDLFAMASFREGLSRSIMEAMAMGKPCVVSSIRGNNDLIINECGGYLCKPNDIGEYAKAINQLIDNPIICKKMGDFNINRIKNYSVIKVVSDLRDIYNTEINALLETGK